MVQAAWMINCEVWLCFNLVLCLCVLCCHWRLKMVDTIATDANVVCIVCYAGYCCAGANLIQLEMLGPRIVCWPWLRWVTNTRQSYAGCVCFPIIHILLQCYCHCSQLWHHCPFKQPSRFPVQNALITNCMSALHYSLSKRMQYLKSLPRILMC